MTSLPCEQLIEHGANVNAVSILAETPLHTAFACKVTNLDGLSSCWKRCGSKCPGSCVENTIAKYSPFAPGCGQISAELVYYYGRQYYHSIGRPS
jgi:hypothetical protein